MSFIGTRERAEAELVPAAGYEIDFVRLRGIDRRNPARAAGALGLAARALPAARRILRSRGADAVLGGGGYVAGPAGLAAIRLGLPLVLTEADSHLGLTNRLLARRAHRVCLAFPIPGREGGRYRVTGRPVPRGVLDADRGQARERLGIGSAEQCVLVFGGSLGARTINLAAAAGLSRPPAGRVVVHITGERDHDLVRGRAGSDQRYRVIPYLDGLGDVLAAADLVVARSGGSIFEIAAAGRPSILVPYPYATGAHQDTNARWLADAGAAVVIADADLDPKLLSAEVDRLLGDPSLLDDMAAAAGGAAKPDAAKLIAAEVLAVIG